MDFIDFEEQLNEHARNLDYEDRIKLGLDICKRLFPHYKSFCNESGFGNPDVLLDSIRFVESGGQDTEQIYEFLDALEEISPDTDDYDEAEYALNACGAVNALLLQVAEPDEEEHFIEIAMAYYDTIDAKVQDEAEEELAEEQLDSHPMVLEAQRFLLQS